MANAYATNFVISSSTHPFSAIWKTTRVMKAAGWTVVGVSNGTNIRTLSGTSSSASLDGSTPTASNANDYWGNNSDPLLDTYSSGMDLVAQWIVMRGPSTIKLSFTTAPGNLFRGESVTQATTGATGELLGITWDSVGSTGWAVIMPRTGTFNSSNVVTGDFSAETFTPTAFAEYKREVLFHKTTTTTTGTIYYLCAEATSEAASFFSKLTEASGCTATVGPGMGGTGNSFPSIAMVVYGTSGATYGSSLFGNASNFNLLGQAGCVNATPASGVSADGSFYCIASVSGSPKVLQFSKCLNSEPGDVDPYVWYSSAIRVVMSTYTNTTAVGTYSNSPTWSYITNGTSDANFLGYIGRGTGTARDKAVAFVASNGASSSTFATSGVNVRAHSSPEASGSTPLIKDLLLLQSIRGTESFFKGSPKWMYFASVGNLYDTYDNYTNIVVLARTATSSPSLLIGPSDGVTIPATS